MIEKFVHGEGHKGWVEVGFGQGIPVDFRRCRRRGDCLSEWYETGYLPEWQLAVIYQKEVYTDNSFLQL